MADHLGHDKHNATGRGSGNSRNGTRVKTALTDNVAPRGRPFTAAALRVAR